MGMIWLSIGVLMATTVGAYAGIQPVPEIDALSGLAAMGVVRFNRCSPQAQDAGTALQVLIGSAREE